MIDRQHGRLVIACDTCGRLSESDSDEWAEVRLQAKREGWQTRHCELLQEDILALTHLLGRTDGRHQRISAHRLAEKGRPKRCGVRRDALIVTSSDYDCRRAKTTAHKFTLQLDTRHLGHIHIDDQAIGHVGGRRLKKGREPKDSFGS
jgi:hypothetical protein